MLLTLMSHVAVAVFVEGLPELGISKTPARKALKLLRGGGLLEWGTAPAAQRRAAQNADDSAFIDLDEEFHLMLADGSGAQHVARLLGQLGAFVRIMRLGAGRSQEELVDVVAEHEAIVDAVESRDEEAAAAALVAHLRAPA